MACSVIRTLIDHGRALLETWLEATGLHSPVGSDWVGFLGETIPNRSSGLLLSCVSS